MLRTVVRLTPALIPILENRNQNDYNLLEPRTPDISETGRDRLKKMFYRNEYDEVSPELRTVVQSGLCGVFFGACMGGFAKSRDAYLYFIENNQATIFQTTMEAKKKLQDYVMIGFAKGAYHWGWRLGIFTGTFRTDQFNQAKEKAAEIKHDSLTKHHDRMVEQKGEIKIEEIK
ncbi:hypothetical protein MSG28_007310 [Choristoneura fumiferana]|uniref:Uncharacterized protein n=1 Tax=Choristoneura fumiferana TaxID=7141 RepID=A0ACC0JWM7_CHOFU|nr:hypothetical protein MSG28_007310 [Choristoneura fumiferana]